jgi:hypothetical protein
MRDSEVFSAFSLFARPRKPSSVMKRLKVRDPQYIVLLGHQSGPGSAVKHVVHLRPDFGQVSLSQVFLNHENGNHFVPPPLLSPCPSPTQLELIAVHSCQSEFRPRRA